MNTNFFNFVDRLVQLCCAKANNSDKAPECQEAADNGISVLSIQEQEQSQDKKDQK